MILDLIYDRMIQTYFVIALLIIAAALSHQKIWKFRDNDKKDEKKDTEKKK